MRRKYKIFLIIITSVTMAYFIYNSIHNNKIFLLSLGDKVSYGISYNYYLKNYYSYIGLLKEHNDSYSKIGYKIDNLLNDIDNRKDILKLINNASIITISFGEEYFSNLKKIDLNSIDDFINNYDKLLRIIKSINNSKVIIIGFYENKNLSNTWVILLNSKLSNLSKKYNYSFIDISDLNNNDIILNNKNSRIVFRRIINNM